MDGGGRKGEWRGGKYWNGDMVRGIDQGISQWRRLYKNSNLLYSVSVLIFIYTYQYNPPLYTLLWAQMGLM